MFYNAIQAESLKVKRNLMFLMLCFMPLISTLIMTIFFLFYDDLPKTDFRIYYALDISVFFILLYPALIAFVGFVYADLEMKNNCNKQLFYLPIKSYNIYFAKCTVLFIYYTISVLIAYVSFILSINLLDAVVPEINESLQQYDSKCLVDSLFLKFYIITLPMVFFQYSISLAVPKVWLPCTLAFFLYIVGLLAFDWDYFYLLPHASLTKMHFSDLRDGNIVIFDKVFVISIFYTLFFFISGYFTFEKSKFKINS